MSVIRINRRSSTGTNPRFSEPSALRITGKAHCSQFQQEQAASRLGLVQKVGSEIHAVVAGLAFVLGVVARVAKAFDDFSFEVFVNARPGEVPHLRRQVLELIRQQSSDLHFHAGYVSCEESDFSLAGKRQQRAFPKKLQRGLIGLDSERVDVGLSGDIPSDALNVVFHGDEEVPPDRGSKFEPVLGIPAFFRGDIAQRKRLQGIEDVLADLLLICPSVGLSLFGRLSGMPHRKHVGGDISGESALRNGR